MKKRLKKKLEKRNKYKCTECSEVIDLKGFYGSINGIPCICGNCINTDY